MSTSTKNLLLYFLVGEIYPVKSFEKTFRSFVADTYDKKGYIIALGVVVQIYDN